MARPNRQGVDYFPLDVHLDDKFKFIEIKYKLEGFAVLIKLMQKIYSYGYWYKWTDDEALLFSDEIRADFDLVKNVVNESLERGVFDKDLHQKYDILTSKGIQKRYKEAVRRRKDVEVTEEYLLIDDIVTTSRQHNDDIVTTSSEHNSGKSTQSKVNKSKVNKNKKDYSKEFSSFWDIYPRNVKKFESSKKFEKCLNEDGLDEILRGVKGYVLDIEKNDTQEQYIMHPSTFLNQRAYKDYLEVEEEPEPTVKVTEEQRIRYRMNELSNDITLGERYFEDKGMVEQYHAAVKEYDELERQLQSYQN